MRKGIAIVTLICFLIGGTYSVYLPIRDSYIDNGVAGGFAALFTILICILFVAALSYAVDWSLKQLKR